MKTFGERVTELRIAAGIKSTTKLAKKVGIAQPTMRAIENDETDPGKMETRTFMNLVAALHTNAAYLWKGRGPIGPDLDANTEEGEAASLYRQLSPPFQTAWMATGHALRTVQPARTASMDNPYPKAAKS